MLLLYYAVGVCVCAVAVAIGLLLRKKQPAKMDTLFKVLSFVLLGAFFFRYMLGDENVSTANFYQGVEGINSKAMVAFALFEVWFAFAAELLVILASFFKNKALPALVTFFGTTVFVLDFALLRNYVIAVSGPTALQGFDVRALLLAIELGLGLAYCIVTIVHKFGEIKLSGKEWIWFALSIVGMIVACTPTYALHTLFSELKHTTIPLDLNQSHRLLLYPMAIIPIGLYLLLKDKDLQTRRLVALYYAWSGMMIFSSSVRFTDLFSSTWATALPLHLCNTAMYVTPLCLTFKWKKLFYFTYFINVFGAFLALTMPNYSDTTSITQPGIWLFYFNHYQAFFMPLLIVGLGLFERPRWKEFKYSMVAFAIYFVAMLICNSLFTAMGQETDYFFINGDFIASKFGNWGENLLLNTLQVNVGSLTLQFYPLYQALFFLAYFALAFAIWFVYELAYNVIVGWQDIGARKKAIKADALALQVALGGRSTKEPINMEGANKLVLKNFTKRYGKSDVYAVKDACLEVTGGEIFGFLGPNGAGKSTIIKSIVGIQTITEGAIEVCGYDVAKQSVMAKSQIGFVPDHYALYERLTAREYINYIADLYEVSQQDRDERLNRFIELFEFQSAIDNPIKTYSHGMKQKVTIMSALIHNPKIWILDEPLTGLDPNSIYQVKECMKEHAAKGNVVFFSSHIIDVVERICDKIAIIRKGQIQCVRDVHEMERKGESLEEFYMSVINDKVVNPIAVEEAKA